MEKDKKSINELQNNQGDVISKKVEVRGEKQKENLIKIIACIVVGICVIMFVGLLCYRLLRTDLSIDSILSTLLAFFSIFISILFYFKADGTSRDFYTKSYDIMKEVSIVLGRIEERFSERLNSLSEKISHFDSESSQKSEEMQQKEDKNNRIINELMDKAKLNAQEKEEYKKRLADNKKEMELLRLQKYNAEREARLLRLEKLNLTWGKDNWEPDNKVFKLLLTTGTRYLSTSEIRALIKSGYLDENGNVNRQKILKELDLQK